MSRDDRADNAIILWEASLTLTTVSVGDRNWRQRRLPQFALLERELKDERIVFDVSHQFAQPRVTQASYRIGGAVVNSQAIRLRFAQRSDRKHDVRHMPGD